MKVVLEAQKACTPHISGIAYYTINLYRSLLKRAKNEYALAFFDQGKERGNRKFIDAYFSGYGSAEFHECNSVSYKNLLVNAEGLYKSACYEDYIGTEGDVLFFPNIYPIPTRIKGKMVIMVHDLIPLLFPQHVTELYSREFQTGIEKVMKMKPLMTVNSKTTKNDLIHHLHIKPEDIFVAYLAQDNSICYPEKNDKMLMDLGVREPYILFLGTIDIRKGIDVIMDAFHHVRRRYPEVSLVMTGLAADQSEILSKQKNALSQERVIFTGYVTDDQKRVLMSGAELFLFPSKYEGFGLPILEAMACGCPVITSNVSSMPEVAGDAGILIDPYNAEELAYQIERVLGSESLRSAMRKKGLARAAEFSWDKTAEQTEAVFQLAKEGI